MIEPKAQTGKAGPNQTIKVAVVHEWLTAYAGSEKVVEQILNIFPQADLFSLVDFLSDCDRAFLKGKKVHTSFIQSLPFSKRLFRKFLWLLPSAIENFDLSGYDVVLSSSHAVAKGIITGPDQLHICYCHSPIRYAWDLQHEYLRQANLTHGLKGIYSRLVLHYMRMWDIRTANGVDYFIANSNFIARRIEKIYRRNSSVIHPPVDIEGFELEETKDNYYVTVSRLVPYKRVDLIVAAFAAMPDRKLVVIGDGPNLEDCRRIASANVEFLGHQPHPVMRKYLSKAKAFLFAAEEDFGISVVEAQACGTPVICFGRGGVLDSVIPGVTGLFFQEQNAESIQLAVERFEADNNEFDPKTIRSHAERFSIDRFRKRYREFVVGQLESSQSRNEEAFDMSLALKSRVVANT